MARPDTVFDGIASAFEGEIYGTSKGYIRLGVLWADLIEAILELGGGTLSILDAGGGAGHLAVRLAQLGNKVVLAEPSGEMVERARVAVSDAGVVEHVRLIQAPIQDLPTLIDEQFDLVICHAVLEWVADPADVLGRLAPFVKPGGILSLLFYNRNARLMKLVLAGSYAEAIRELSEPSPHGWGSGAVPLAENEVREWLSKLGFEVTSKAGIRIFHDLLADELREAKLLPELLEVELALRRMEPFASLAQHVHLVASRPPHRSTPASDGKLVRDLVPQLIAEATGSVQTRQLLPAEHVAALRAKVDEELAEYDAAADRDDALAELADVLEVIYGLAGQRGVSAAELDAVREAKARARGRFATGTWLVQRDTMT